MAYKSRIPADPKYIQALGTAFYNFTSLEWVVMWTIAKLSADAFESVPKRETAFHIAKALIRAIDTTTLALPSPLRSELVKFHESYVKAIRQRNKLLHAHPYTAVDGSQRLMGGGYRWSIEEVEAAAKLFEDACIEGNRIFHGGLTKARP